MNGLFNLPEGGAVEDELALPADATSLDLMQAIYRDPSQPMTRRMKAAVAALPFEHPKLAVTVNTDAANFANRMEEAIRRSGRSNIIDGKSNSVTNAPRLAEPKQTGPAQIETDPDEFMERKL